MKLFLFTAGCGAAVAASASTLRGSSASEPGDVDGHKPFYHMEGSGRKNPICYETTYTDAHYREQGFALGSCEDKFSKKLGSETDQVCDGHSEVNIKDCPTEVVEITVIKLGVADDAADTADAPPHDPFYHVEAAMENLCYETTYTDAHYQSEGFTLGPCDDSYTSIEEKRTEQVCDQHSEVNVKNCPTSVVDIQILKLGKNRRQLQHRPFYHLVAAQESVCFETTYTDEHFRQNGFELGTCGDTYTKVLAHDDERICNGHSERNIKYCPDDIITIDVVKKGKGAVEENELATVDTATGIVYHLEAQLEAVCYETNYTDAHYQSEGFVVGRCDESYNTIIARDDEEICDGHSEENIKYCPGATRKITVYKFGKAAEETVADGPTGIVYHVEAAAEAVCFETNYTDAHYQSEGFVVGRCDESYNTLENVTNPVICNGHSEENVKYCPDSTLAIVVYKFGKQ